MLPVKTINVQNSFAPVYKNQKEFLAVGYNFKKNNLTDKKKHMESCGSKVNDYLYEYLAASTLHGFKYVGDTSLSYGERFLWLSAIGFAMFAAIYFILAIYDKYDKSPVIITMNPIPITPFDMPFPAITICNLNKVLKDEAEKVEKNGTITDKSFLDDTCDFEETAQVKRYDRKTEKFDNYFRFIKKVYPSCSQMLGVCKWCDEERNCTEMFHEGLTDEGLCCTYNQLPPSLIVKPGTRTQAYNISQLEVDDWNPERGYASNASLEVYPYRSVGSGAHLGLTVVLDTMTEKYFCSSLYSAGFKVMLHTPTDMPRVADFSFLVAPGYTTRINFTPDLFDAVDIRSIAVDKRNCYFNDEKYLKHFRIYTEVNCKLECLANRTLADCGCAPFYLPASSKEKVCGKRDDQCVDRVKLLMETANHSSSNEHRWCGCLQGCFSIEYNKILSNSKFTGNFRLVNGISKNVTNEYFMENMAVLQVFFTARNFKKYTKSRLYGFSELVSNTGGLLGLFLGFSVLSIVEIFYYFTIRLFCLYTRNKKTKTVKLVKIAK